jgi:hypothetical protein
VGEEQVAGWLGGARGAGQQTDTSLHQQHPSQLLQLLLASVSWDAGDADGSDATPPRSVGAGAGAGGPWLCMQVWLAEHGHDHGHGHTAANGGPLPPAAGLRGLHSPEGPQYSPRTSRDGAPAPPAAATATSIGSYSVFQAGAGTVASRPSPAASASASAFPPGTSGPGGSDGRAPLLSSLGKGGGAGAAPPRVVSVVTLPGDSALDIARRVAVALGAVSVAGLATVAAAGAEFGSGSGVSVRSLTGGSNNQGTELIGADQPLQPLLADEAYATGGVVIRVPASALAFRAATPSGSSAGRRSGAVASPALGPDAMGGGGGGGLHASLLGTSPTLAAGSEAPTDYTPLTAGQPQQQPGGLYGGMDSRFGQPAGFSSKHGGPSSGWDGATGSSRSGGEDFDLRQSQAAGMGLGAGLTVNGVSLDPYTSFGQLQQQQRFGGAASSTAGGGRPGYVPYAGPVNPDVAPRKSSSGHSLPPPQGQGQRAGGGGVGGSGSGPGTHQSSPAFNRSSTSGSNSAPTSEQGGGGGGSGPYLSGGGGDGPGGDVQQLQQQQQQQQFGGAGGSVITYSPMDVRSVAASTGTGAGSVLTQQQAQWDAGGLRPAMPSAGSGGGGGYSDYGRYPSGASDMSGPGAGPGGGVPGMPGGDYMGAPGGRGGGGGGMGVMPGMPWEEGNTRALTRKLHEGTLLLQQHIEMHAQAAYAQPPERRHLPVPPLACPPVLLEALETVASITFDEKNKGKSLAPRDHISPVDRIRYHLYECGCVPLLLEAVRLLPVATAECRQALEHAIQALCNIGFNHTAQSAMTAAGTATIPALVERMAADIGVAEVQIKVARCLTALCFENTVAQVQVLHAGGLYVIAKAIWAHSSHQFAVEKLLGLILALHHAPSFLAELHRSGLGEMLANWRRPAGGMGGPGGGGMGRGGGMGMGGDGGPGGGRSGAVLQRADEIVRLWRTFIDYAR